jgi:hypothetical protein
VTAESGGSTRAGNQRWRDTVRRTIATVRTNRSRMSRALRTGTEIILLAGIAGTVGMVARRTAQDVTRPALERLRPSNHPYTSGRELIVALIASSGCGFSRHPDAQRAFRSIVISVRQQAAARNIPTVSVVGVAAEWSPDAGIDFLRNITTFDEMIVGRNWLNSGLDRYVRSTGGDLAVPQVLVLERQITATDSTIVVHGERLLSKHEGLRAILDWAESGARIAELDRPIADASAPAVARKSVQEGEVNTTVSVRAQ